jgi:hypothetical protein
MLNKSETEEIATAKKDYDAALQEFIQTSGLPKDIPHDKVEYLMLSFATNLLSLVFTTPEIVTDFVPADQDKTPLLTVQEQLKKKYSDIQNGFLEALKSALPNDEIKRYFTSAAQNAPTQTELFPVFKPQKSVELKKEFALNFGSIERIEKDYPALLSVKLTSGKTLQWHLDEVRDWFNNLRGEDLGNWIKLFAFVKSVKEFTGNANNAVSNIADIGNGRYCFRIKANKDFFAFFIKPDKTSRQFTTKAKDKFLKWLYDNQKTVTFPIICEGRVWMAPVNIYSYVEDVAPDGKKDILFSVDTNILESEFKGYVSIDTAEIDNIAEAWEVVAKANPVFANLRLNNFVDLPLRFLFTLKTIYNRAGNYENRNGEKPFTGNHQSLTDENFDHHLGGLDDRIQKHLESRHAAREGKSAAKVNEVKSLLLETTFTIAKTRQWLLTDPIYKDGVYKFNLNAGYFDTRAIAKRLQVKT